MSRATSELASSFLFNLGKGTAEPQIPAAGWKDAPHVKGEMKGACRCRVLCLIFL